jgi:hypothetical protein
LRDELAAENKMASECMQIFEERDAQMHRYAAMCLRNVLKIAEHDTVKGTYACPKCGLDTPHIHSPEPRELAFEHVSKRMWYDHQISLSIADVRMIYLDVLKTEAALTPPIAKPSNAESCSTQSPLHTKGVPAGGEADVSVPLETLRNWMQLASCGPGGLRRQIEPYTHPPLAKMEENSK